MYENKFREREEEKEKGDVWNTFFKKKKQNSSVSFLFKINKVYNIGLFSLTELES